MRRGEGEVMEGAVLRGFEAFLLGLLSEFSGELF